MNWLKFTIITMSAAYLVWKGLSHPKVDALKKRSKPAKAKQKPGASTDDLAATLADETDPLERL